MTGFDQKFALRLYYNQWNFIPHIYQKCQSIIIHWELSTQNNFLSVCLKN